MAAGMAWSGEGRRGARPKPDRLIAARQLALAWVTAPRHAPIAWGGRMRTKAPTLASLVFLLESGHAGTAVFRVRSRVHRAARCPIPEAVLLPSLCHPIPDGRAASLPRLCPPHPTSLAQVLLPRVFVSGTPRAAGQGRNRRVRTASGAVHRTGTSGLRRAPRKTSGPEPRQEAHPAPTVRRMRLRPERRPPPRRLLPAAGRAMSVSPLSWTHPPRTRCPLVCWAPERYPPASLITLGSS